MPKARNIELRGETVNTAYGLVQLDDQGYATNLDDLGISDEAIIANVPGFVDGEVHKGELPSACSNPSDTSCSSQTGSSRNRRCEDRSGPVRPR
jgi:hypothetical protein